MKKEEIIHVDEGVKEEALKYGKYVLPNDDEHQVIIFDKIVLEVPLEVDEKEIEEEVDQQLSNMPEVKELIAPLEEVHEEISGLLEVSEVSNFPEVKVLIAHIEDNNFIEVEVNNLYKDLSMLFRCLSISLHACLPA